MVFETLDPDMVSEHRACCCIHELTQHEVTTKTHHVTQPLVLVLGRINRLHNNKELVMPYRTTACHNGKMIVSKLHA